jgi:hypothetical protein
MCIRTVDMAIDNGLNTGVTLCNVTKFTGPWKFTPMPRKDLLLSLPGSILMWLEYNKKRKKSTQDEPAIPWSCTIQNCRKGHILLDKSTSVWE